MPKTAKTKKKTSKKQKSSGLSFAQNYTEKATLYICITMLLFAVVALLLITNDTQETQNNEIAKLKAGSLSTQNVMYKDVESVWHDEGYTFSVESVYYTPNIADIDEWFDGNVGGQYLVVGVKVRNNHVQGDRRCVETGNYLRIKGMDEGLEKAPINFGDVCLYPQEEGIVYTAFMLGNEESDVTLYSGLLTRPKVTQVNFGEDDDVTLGKGVFSLENGFVENSTQ